MRKHPDACCEVCPLQSKPAAFTQGPPNATVAVVSRSPGYSEALTGKCFQGPAGDVLDHLLKLNGVKREDILVTNTVLCATDAGKVPPEAIKACAPRLEQELKGTTLVIAAGSEAVNLLLGRGAIEKYRGYRIVREGSERTYVATNNPALVLRDDSTFPNLVKDFRRAFHPIPPPILPQVEVIEDANRARAYLLGLAPDTYIAADVESRGGLTHKASIVSMQFAVNGRNATVIGEREGLFGDRDFLETLRKTFERRDIHFIFHNGKFDTKILQHTYGIDARVDEDTLLMSYALDERGGVHALDYLLMEEFGWPNYEADSVKKFKKTGVVEDYDEFHRYAGLDAAGTFQLFDLLRTRIQEEDVERPYRMLIAGSEALTKMELAGFRYDSTTAADIMEEEVGPELKQIAANLKRTLDNPLYNPRSPKQNSHLYYDLWRIHHEMRSRPDKSRSTDVSALEEIAAGRFVTQVQDTPVVAFTKELLRYRQLDKQATTYIIGLLKQAEGDPDGKVYTDLLLHGTTSGRLSSRNPNLQNITRPKDGLPDIRSLFVASPGRHIVQADYSQAELRCIAAFSGDTRLTSIYMEAQDLHDTVAERFFGPNFTKEQRSNCKNMNFGVAYRQGAATFQEKHGIPEKQAQKFIDWWWEEFSGVKKWEEEVEKEIKKGHLVSPYGRKRRFHLLTRENIQAVFREGINFYPQTTASDLTLRSAIILSREIDWNRAAIVLSVHDSIISDVLDEYVREYSTICKQVMEERAKVDLGWNIPLVVDIKHGNTWGDC